MAIARTTLRMSWMDSYPVEIEITELDTDYVSPEMVLRVLKEYQLAGFGMPFSYNKSEKSSVIGKKGTVKSVNPIKTKNGHDMYEITAVLDDGGTEVKWNEFTASAFRARDRVEIVKNERGYTVGKFITEQKTDDIPF